MPFVFLVFLCLALATDVDRPHGMLPQEFNGEFHDLARPALASVTADCRIKHAAYDYSRKIMPEFGNQQATFDALQLDQCGLQRPGPDKRVHIPELSIPGLKLFVDFEKGHDVNSGSIEEPKKTIEAALREARADRTHKNKIIYLRKGYHEVSKPVVFSPADENTTITSFNNEEVVVSGAKRVEVNWEKFMVGVFEDFENQDVVGFMKVSPGADLKGRAKCYGKVNSVEKCKSICESDRVCTGYTYYNTADDWQSLCYGIIDGEFTFNPKSNVFSGVRKNIYVTDLSQFSIDESQFTSLFINDKRQILARYPNGNPEYTGYHTQNSGFISGKEGRWMQKRPFPPAFEIHIDKPAIKKTLYPNYQTAVGGTGVQWDPPINYWALAKPIGGGGCTYSVPQGITINQRQWSHRKWEKDQGVGSIFHAFQGNFWGFWMFEVDKVVKRDNDIDVFWTKGGFQECRGSSHGGDFFVENVFEELDAPGEYFYDRKAKKLFLYPNGTIDDMRTIYISQLENIFEIRGSETSPVRNISIRGLTLAYTRNIYMEKHEVPSAGDWAIHRGGAIFVDGAEDIDIGYNIFRNNGNTGVFIANHVVDSKIHHNEFTLGSDSGIIMNGASDLMDGTGHKHPRDMIIEKNLFHELGLYNKQSAPFFQSKSARTLFRNNTLFNIPRAGVMVNDAFGGGHVIEYSVMFNAVRETADHGPVNTWDRMPFITTYDTGAPSPKPKESVIRNSFVIANYHSVWPLDHDDGSCYWYDYDNVLVYGGFKTYLGHSKKSMNNYYFYPDTKYAGDTNEFFTEPFCCITAGRHETYGWGEVYRNNTCVINNADVYWFTTVGEHFDELIPDMDYNTIYSPHKQVNAKLDSTKMPHDVFRSKGKDVHSVIRPMVTPEQVEKMARDKLHIY